MRAMKKNEAEIKNLEAIAFGIGVDVVSLKLSKSIANSDYYRTSSSQYSPELVDQTQFSCPSGLDKLYIDPNGDVFPCCFSEGEPDMKVGNALKTPLPDLWDNYWMQKLRETFENQTPLGFCLKECSGICHKEKINIKKNKYPKRSLSQTFKLT